MSIIEQQKSQQGVDTRVYTQRENAGVTTIAVATAAKKEMKYLPLGEKKEVTLTVGLVRKYLCVTTRRDLSPDDDEIIRFMMMCERQFLNPWVGDAFLIGYDTKDGPKFNLIVAHQALLKRAESSPNYRGMESGVVVVNSESLVIERHGDLLYPGDQLIGGWARVYRDDRSIQSYDAMNFSTYNTSRSRWNADPCGMIVKVAEGSALRKAFPSVLSAQYSAEEMSSVSGVDIQPHGGHVNVGEFTEVPSAVVEVRPAAVTGVTSGESVKAEKTTKPRAAKADKAVADKPRERLTPEDTSVPMPEDVDYRIQSSAQDIIDQSGVVSIDDLIDGSVDPRDLMSGGEVSSVGGVVADLSAVAEGDEVSPGAAVVYGTDWPTTLALMEMGVGDLSLIKAELAKTVKVGDLCDVAFILRDVLASKNLDECRNHAGKLRVVVKAKAGEVPACVSKILQNVSAALR